MGPAFLHLLLEHHDLTLELLDALLILFLLLDELQTLLFGLYEVDEEHVTVRLEHVTLVFEVTILKPKLIVVLHSLFEHGILLDAESLALLLGVAESFANGVVLTREHRMISKYTVSFIIYIPISP